MTAGPDHVVGADELLGADPGGATPSPRRPVTASVVLALAAAGTWLRRMFHRALDAWRRSLQLRIGVTTLVITTALMVVVGIFLVDKVAGGVVKAKQDAAINQVKLLENQAESILRGADPTTVGAEEAYTQLTSELTPGTGTAGSFQLALISSAGTNGIPDTRTIPKGLRDSVQRGYLSMAYAPVPQSGPGQGGSNPAPTSQSVKGLIIGEPVSSTTTFFELYYLFPLTSEDSTIALIQRTVAIAGFALVLLVLGTVLLVTRQVVTPVRVAARTAESLAGGDLTQRITVRGSDDVALLGQSFNDMADSLQRQIRRLEDLSRLQRRFTSDVSHELRTPLTTIRMAAELLHAGREEFPPELARSAELLEAELDRFESLLGDLLEISRYDAGVANLESEDVDIRGVIATVVAANEVLARRHGSEMIIDVPDTPVPVDIDARRVERIMRNLIGNALDHGEGRPVIITVAADGDAVAVAVRDHGVGLRPGQAAMVFNRFWRGDPSRSRLTGGTGLGLAIALEDARLHDGWLQAWGEPGRGAQFRLTLPRRAGHTLLHSPIPLDPDEQEEDDE